MPTFIRFCSSLPWLLSLLIIHPESFFLDKHIWAIVRSTPLISCFGLPRFHAVPCLVFIHLHPDTNRQYRMISVYLFSLLFRFDILFLFQLTLTLSQTGFRFFKNIYHKNSKNIVHLLLRPRSFVELVSPPVKPSYISY